MDSLAAWTALNHHGLSSTGLGKVDSGLGSRRLKDSVEGCGKMVWLEFLAAV